MSYTTGTINSATPATALMAALQTPIAAHAAWEFVETVVGTGANVCDVYKCLGSLNAHGTDFFVGICRAATTGNVGLIVGETYDGVAKEFGKGAPYVATSGTIATAADGSFATPKHVANANHLASVATGNLFAAQVPTTTSSLFTWYLSVTNDRIILAKSAGNQDAAAYAGLYESHHAIGLDPFPLVTCKVYISAPAPTTGASVGATTRDPTVSGTVTSGFAAFLDPYWTVPYGKSRVNGSNTNSKESISAKWWPSRIPLAQQSLAGSCKGLLRDVVFIVIGGTTEVVGDTAVIDGVTYTCFAPETNYFDAGTTSAVSSAPAASPWVSQAV